MTPSGTSSNGNLSSACGLCVQQTETSSRDIDLTKVEKQGIETNNTRINTDTDIFIVLDWDDTIFPTSVISHLLAHNKCDVRSLSDNGVKLFNTLAGNTLRLLTYLIRTYGTKCIHIVTNSMDGWIQQSLDHAASICTVYSQIKELLFGNDITMLSAQSMYGAVCREPICWKASCVASLLQKHPPKSHVLSIGDQWVDHRAVQQSIGALQYPAIHHMIKLKTVPNIKDMIAQMGYIGSAFDSVFNDDFNKATTAMEPQILDYHYEEMKYYCDTVQSSNPIH